MGNDQQKTQTQPSPHFVETTTRPVNSFLGADSYNVAAVEELLVHANLGAELTQMAEEAAKHQGGDDNLDAYHRFWDRCNQLLEDALMTSRERYTSNGPNTGMQNLARPACKPQKTPQTWVEVDVKDNEVRLDATQPKLVTATCNGCGRTLTVAEHLTNPTCPTCQRQTKHLPPAGYDLGDDEDLGIEIQERRNAVPVVRCDCTCHTLPNVTHNAPCCQGQCLSCGDWFASGLVEHARSCEETALAEEESTPC